MPIISAPRQQAILPPEPDQGYWQRFMQGATGPALSGREAPGVSPAITYPPPAPESPGPRRWVKAAQPPAIAGPDQYWAGIEQAYKNLPIDKAQQAISAAMQYQAMRGYQADLQSGKPADQVLARWAPMMFGKMGAAGGMTGAASMIRATQPKPDFKYVPGAEGEPASFQAPGQRPVIVPRSAMPLKEGMPEVDIKEISPGAGVYVVRSPGQPVKIATAKGGELTEAQKANLLAKIPSMQKQLLNLDEESPEYSQMTNVINTVRQMAMGRPASPLPGAPTEVAPPPSAGGKSPFTEGQKVRNKKTGKVYVIRNGVPVEE